MILRNKKKVQWHKWCVPACESRIDLNEAHYHRGGSSPDRLIAIVNSFYNCLLHHISMSKGADGRELLGLMTVTNHRSHIYGGWTKAITDKNTVTVSSSGVANISTQACRPQEEELEASGLLCSAQQSALHSAECGDSSSCQNVSVPRPASLLSPPTLRARAWAVGHQ